MNNETARKFLESLNLEVQSQACRVRDLIGSVHWLSDGEHKESLVREIIRNYVPETFEVGTGFVVDPLKENAVSRQLDIVVTDNRFETPLFRQTDFSINFVTTLVAAISVKSKFSKASFTSTLENLLSVTALATEASLDQLNLSGVFFDDEASARSISDLVKKWIEDDEEIRESLGELRKTQVHIATTGGFLMRIRTRSDAKDNSCYCVTYDCMNLAFPTLVGSVIAGASYRTQNCSTNFSSFLKNAWSGNMIENILLEAPAD